MRVLWTISCTTLNLLVLGHTVPFLVAKLFREQLCIWTWHHLEISSIIMVCCESQFQYLVDN